MVVAALGTKPTGPRAIRVLAPPGVNVIWAVFTVTPEALRFEGAAQEGNGASTTANSSRPISA